MSLFLHMWTRKFDRRYNLTGLKIQVTSMSWKAMGGPEEANVSFTGPRLMLWRLLETLRNPVEIADEFGQRVWWGYVYEARVREESIEIGASLDSLANKIAVVYSRIQPGSNTVGQRATTDWAIDTDSTAEYGTKELLLSTDGLSDAAAISKRDTMLALRKKPRGTTGNFGSPDSSVEWSGAEESLSATLYLKGWWSTLSWKYAKVDPITQWTGYSGGTASSYSVGDATARTSLLQFMDGHDQCLNAKQITLSLKKVGNPTDNLTVELYEYDIATAKPGNTLLASATIAGTSLSTTATSVTLTLNAAVNLLCTYAFSRSTRQSYYCIKIGRSGAVNASNYYQVGGAYMASPFSETLFYWNGSAWVRYGTQTWITWTLLGDNNIETTNQVLAICGQYGQFLEGFDLESRSSVSQPSQMDGQTDTQRTIEKLLNIGNSSGRRLLAQVTPERWMHVFLEPADTTVKYLMDRDGKIRFANGKRVAEYMPPVGVWCKLADVVPGNVDLALIADPTLQFIERASWSDLNGMQLEFRGAADWSDVMGVTS